MTDERIKELYDAFLAKEKYESQCAASDAMTYMCDQKEESRLAGLQHVRNAQLWEEARRMLQLARCEDGRPIR